MEKFIRDANIARFTAQIKTQNDPTKLEMLHRLLAEEVAKVPKTWSGGRGWCSTVSTLPQSPHR
jgi:hypothetical protein